jgi:hypothetical protein
MSSRCAPALHYKVSGIGRKRLPHHPRYASQFRTLSENRTYGAGVKAQYGIGVSGLGLALSRHGEPIWRLGDRRALAGTGFSRNAIWQS